MKQSSRWNVYSFGSLVVLWFVFSVSCGCQSNRHGDSTRVPSKIASAQATPASLADRSGEETVEAPSEAFDVVPPRRLLTKTSTTAVVTIDQAIDPASTQDTVVPTLAAAVVADESSEAANDLLVLVNPLANRVTLTFLVNGKPFQLAPGESKEFPESPESTIEFHRGGSFGEAKESISAGHHEFRVGTTGWELVPSR